jgi:4-hydroxybenzoate polyprenyltransferase
MLDGPVFAVMMLGILETLIYAFIIVSIIMLVYEIKRNKSDFDLPKGDSFLTEKEKTTRFFTHPVMVTLLVFLAISIYVISFLPPTTVAV